MRINPQVPSSLRSLYVVVTFAAVCLSACGQPVNDEAGVRTALESFYAAMKAGDTAAAMALIAEDAVFAEGGRLETRAEYEKNHLPADIGFEKEVSGKRGPLKITFKGDAAWVIATTDYDGTFEGAPVSFTSAQLAVLTRESGNWKIRSIHWSSRRR
jgi:ketosteroid isomerase-like protein